MFIIFIQNETSDIDFSYPWSSRFLIKSENTVGQTHDNPTH